MGSSSDATLDASRTPPLTRIRQGLRALRPRATPPLPERFARDLPAPVVATWDALSTYDRRHVIAVANDLEDAGHPPHLVLAGLLHDIGKVGRVTVVDRTASVLLGRLAPGIRERLAARPRPLPGLDGLHLLLHHAERGADLLASAGVPADVVWLVRHHEREFDSTDLRALQAADHRH